MTRDVTVGGQHLRRNDRVVISWLAANRDEHEFEHADEIVLDRTPNRHLAFGLGPHRCIGSHLARLMSEVMVKAVLRSNPGLPGRPRRRLPIPRQPEHDRAGQTPGHLHPRSKASLKGLNCPRRARPGPPSGSRTPFIVLLPRSSKAILDPRTGRRIGRRRHRDLSGPRERHDARGNMDRDPVHVAVDHIVHLAGVQAGADV